MDTPLVLGHVATFFTGRWPSTFVILTFPQSVIMTLGRVHATAVYSEKWARNYGHWWLSVGKGWFPMGKVNKICVVLQ